MTKKFFVSIKMSYHQFNRQELWQKAKYGYYNCCGNEKATQFYIQNKEVPKQMKETSIETYQKNKKKIKKEYQINRYRNITNNTRTWKYKHNITFLYSIKWVRRH